MIGPHATSYLFIDVMKIKSPTAQICSLCLNAIAQPYLTISGYQLTPYK